MVEVCGRFSPTAPSASFETVCPAMATDDAVAPSNGSAKPIWSVVA